MIEVPLTAEQINYFWKLLLPLGETVDHGGTLTSSHFRVRFEDLTGYKILHHGKVRPGISAVSSVATLFDWRVQVPTDIDAVEFKLKWL